MIEYLEFTVFSKFVKKKAQKANLPDILERAHNPFHSPFLNLSKEMANTENEYNHSAVRNK